MQRRLASVTLAAAFLLVAFAAVTPTASPVRLARYPDYHAGTIAFSYLGDIWTASEDGTRTKRLTDHRAREVYPRFSPDGRLIAFSSNRYGNYDVFVVPATGGTPKRLTFHTGTDDVVGWTRDSQNVIFRSARGDGAFPTVATMYQIAVAGGQEQPLPVDWGIRAVSLPTASRSSSTAIPRRDRAGITVAAMPPNCGSRTWPAIVTRSCSPMNAITVLKGQMTTRKTSTSSQR